MRTFNWRTAALVALTSSALVAHAMGQQSTSGGQSQSGAEQKSSSSSSSQDQKQTTTNDKSASNKRNSDNNTQSGSAQSRQDSDNSQNQANQQRDRHDSQDQSNRNHYDRSNANSAADRTSSSHDRDRDRSYSRDRSDRDNDRNADNRSSNRDRDSSREHSSRRGNLRGPDIGIWFNRSGAGLVIADVSSRGPIAKLGFREGDRIVSVNGQRVTSEDDFIRLLLRSEARRLPVIVLRDNRETTIYVEPAVLVDDQDSVEADPLERFGIMVDDRYDDRIVVWRVIPRSPAYYAGFRPGDVVVKFGDRPYRTRTEFETGSRSWKPGEVDVQVRRGDRTRDLKAEISSDDRADRRSDRSPLRNERTAQRDVVPSDQGTSDRNDQNYKKDQRDNRGGILNNIRSRANR